MAGICRDGNESLALLFFPEFPLFNDLSYSTDNHCIFPPFKFFVTAVFCALFVHDIQIAF